jgi:hypothetical protein
MKPIFFADSIPFPEQHQIKAQSAQNHKRRSQGVLQDLVLIFSPRKWAIAPKRKPQFLKVGLVKNRLGGLVLGIYL